MYKLIRLIYRLEDWFLYIKVTIRMKISSYKIFVNKKCRG